MGNHKTIGTGFRPLKPREKELIAKFDKRYNRNKPLVLSRIYNFPHTARTMRVSYQFIDNFTICTIIWGLYLYTGASKRNPQADSPNADIGMDIAFYRALHSEPMRYDK